MKKYIKQFITPPLPYDYAALEPYIDQQTMKVHHDKHHVGYTIKLNAALEKHPDFFQYPAEVLLQKLEKIPTEVRTAVKNNGGGHVHHSFFWKIMTPAKQSDKPNQQLIKALDSAFGSFDKFKEMFENAATTLFGSGWTWLSVVNNKLIIEQTSNQDSPYSLGHRPILALDVWEHAYYLKYKNVRADYVKNFWDIINWNQVAENFATAK
ncbi:MAG: superoxide dismutase [Candidatus Komeilibacteria bacterium CG11_big_fil_rev_8_21_14_0_20_36_20]|uniref:Superoxide dismutase n=1 Tax=Candidatus Komeilibacteria bacterium CG11_big_fil_rev_8_21_14_0_20_36_20 TaxID=1974477 RepID=A0A2H0NC69_9BACT|nr:MAG: superoxide dismutase [Candidatus Komeilibacteria bacterium CG11_big_fil_rev_8_21_14_0_20_36_20]PIR81761.1 MAG: superoxide dismutase [Candidatus Komeilibacteria bacterium CG10_big_fil_rev_8_21_14_0_10_36_65]PJC55578.1 MAG: superoxide dismutase [Candidatus Komeilibacteria bacterium CG_4_9_14_0_2_um_filter_36_13]